MFDDCPLCPPSPLDIRSRSIPAYDVPEPLVATFLHPFGHASTSNMELSLALEPMLEAAAGDDGASDGRPPNSQISEGVRTRARVRTCVCVRAWLPWWWRADVSLVLPWFLFPPHLPFFKRISLTHARAYPYWLHHQGEFRTCWRSSLS